MKHLRYYALFLSSLLLVSCGSDQENESQEENQENEPVLTTEDDLEHDSNEPFLFPFGLEIENLEPTGYREGCGGDCCSGTKVLEKGEYTLFLDTTDCWEYGYTEKYLLYRGEDLIASHEKSFDMGEYMEDYNLRHRMERTIDFENEKVFVRRDTVRNDEEKWINKYFDKLDFSSGLKDEVEKFIFDPRERYSFTDEHSVNLNRFGDEGKLSSVFLFHSLSSHDFDIEVIDAYALQEVSDREGVGIPKDAVFAYSTWYAGSGDLLYGKFNDGVLQIYQSWEDEALSEIPPYELLLEVDPELEIPSPDHYIVLDPKNGGKNKLMLAMNDVDRVLYAKYEGQSRHIELQFKEDNSEGKRIEIVYDELIHGIPNGTYTHTHDGIWDYVTYKGKNGKVVKFVINHSLTSPEDSGTYRDRPLF